VQWTVNSNCIQKDPIICYESGVQITMVKTVTRSVAQHENALYRYNNAR
jgi:hypothetical protein